LLAWTIELREFSKYVVRRPTVLQSSPLWPKDIVQVWSLADQKGRFPNLKSRPAMKRNDFGIVHKLARFKDRLHNIQ
jgi:hypothetical protein